MLTSDSASLKRLFLAGFGLAVLASTPAYSATYQIGLFQGATGTGSGSFTFTNTGSSGPATVSLATNASSSIGVQTFQSGNLNVQVAAVDFNDNKTPPNQITGNFVEGLTGSLQTTPAVGLTQTGQCNQQSCFYRITFAFTSNANPTLAAKTYMIELVRTSNGNIVDTPVPSGTYSVSNTLTIPEPDSLVLLGAVLAALAWALRKRRPHRGGLAG
jgi:hypothetical protein